MFRDLESCCQLTRSGTGAKTELLDHNCTATITVNSSAIPFRRPVEGFVEADSQERGRTSSNFVVPIAAHPADAAAFSREQVRNHFAAVHDLHRASERTDVFVVRIHLQ